MAPSIAIAVQDDESTLKAIPTLPPALVVAAGVALGVPVAVVIMLIEASVPVALIEVDSGLPLVALASAAVLEALPLALLSSRRPNVTVSGAPLTIPTHSLK